MHLLILASMIKRQQGTSIEILRNNHFIVFFCDPFWDSARLKNQTYLASKYLKRRTNASVVVMGAVFFHNSRFKVCHQVPCCHSSL